jgi:hypothetical protein
MAFYLDFINLMSYVRKNNDFICQGINSIVSSLFFIL